MKIVVLKPLTFAATACALTMTLHAAEGLLIVQRTTVAGGQPQTAQVQIEKTRMRSEIADETGVKQAMVFDGVKQVMTIINMQKKTYSEITKADLDRMAAQLSDAMSQMQAQLANLPPAQRQQVEQMMAGRGGLVSLPKTEYRKIGTDKVGRWTCDKYEGVQNGQKSSEICTVDPSALGFAVADLEISQQFGAFFKSLMPQMTDQMFKVGKPADQGFAGIPVRTITTLMGRTSTTELVDVSHQSFGDAVFAVPAGFKKEDFMGAGRGRGRGGN